MLGRRAAVAPAGSQETYAFTAIGIHNAVLATEARKSPNQHPFCACCAFCGHPTDAHTRRVAADVGIVEIAIAIEIGIEALLEPYLNRGWMQLGFHRPRPQRAPRAVLVRRTRKQEGRHSRTIEAKRS